MSQEQEKVTSQQTVARGVVTEIRDLVKEQQHSGGLHFYTTVPGMVIVKVPGKEDYEKIPVQQKRRYNLETLQGVAEAAKVAKEKFGGDPVIFVDRNEVVLSFQENAASLHLASGVYKHRLSPEWKCLLGLKQQPTMGVEGVRKWLRIDMRAGATDSSKALERSLQSLSAKTEQRTRSMREGGKESLGRDIDAEVTSANGEIPNACAFHVRPFLDPDVSAGDAVEVFVDVEPRNLDVTLVAQEADMEEVLVGAVLKAVEVLKLRLSEVDLPDVPVILGSAS